MFSNVIIINSFFKMADQRIYIKVCFQLFSSVSVEQNSTKVFKCLLNDFTRMLDYVFTYIYLFTHYKTCNKVSFADEQGFLIRSEKKKFYIKRLSHKHVYFYKKISLTYVFSDSEAPEAFSLFNVYVVGSLVTLHTLCSTI